MNGYERFPILDAYATMGRRGEEFDAAERKHVRKLVAAKRISVPTIHDEPTVAYVSDNRWVADCLVCNGGIAVAHDRAYWTCWDCGTGYRIEWPDTPLEQAAVAELLQRAPRLRNYYPTVDLAARRNRVPDTPGSLRAENALLGLDHQSWTSPRTWVTGELVTASIMNTHIRDNLNETSPALVTTEGDILVASGANALARLAEGTDNEYLRVITGTVSWSA